MTSTHGDAPDLARPANSMSRHVRPSAARSRDAARRHRHGPARSDRASGRSGRDRSRSSRHRAPGLDFVVHHDQYTLAARLGAAGDPQRVDEVSVRGISAEHARPPLHPDQHDRLADPRVRVRKEARSPPRVAVPCGMTKVRRRQTPSARCGDDRIAQFDPVIGADRGSSDLTELTGTGSAASRVSENYSISPSPVSFCPKMRVIEHVEKLAPREEIVPPVPITAMSPRGNGWPTNSPRPGSTR